MPKHAVIKLKMVAHLLHPIFMGCLDDGQSIFSFLMLEIKKYTKSIRTCHLWPDWGQKCFPSNLYSICIQNLEPQNPKMVCIHISQAPRGHDNGHYQLLVNLDSFVIRVLVVAIGEP